MTLRPTIALLFLAACAGPRPHAHCGIVGLAGPSLLLEEFTKRGKTLSAVPDKMPERLVARMAGGPAYPAVAGKTDSSWVIGIDAPVPDKPRLGFGVLVLDRTLGVRGLLLYEGSPMPGAPILGTVNAGNLNIPFHGIEVAVAGFEDVACPLFPDSLKR
jgi:hypothetical protein